MFTRQKQFKSLCTWLSALFLFVAVFIFVCPLPDMNATYHANHMTPLLCPGHVSHIVLPGAMDSSANCFGLHFSIVEAFVGSLSTKIDALAIILLAIFCLCTVIAYSKLRTLLDTQAMRFRKYRLRYFHIRYLVRKKILAWISVIHSYSVSSV